ncbi:MAG: flippase-like domain-containing protein [Chloroflexi bacterium]|nr:flippase-like domain-containing protein [Chloroflexota bacterium]
MTDKTLERRFTVEWRHVIWLALLALACFLFLPRLIGFGRVAAVLQLSHPVFLGLALGSEVLRYFASAGSTIVLARLFGVDVPFLPMTEAFFAGAAANRTFSTGGAPGMLIRFAFLVRQGVHGGAVAVVFLIEDIIGAFIGLVVLIVGIVTLTNALPEGAFAADASIFLAAASPVLLAVGWYVYRRRPWVERVVHGVARRLNRPLEWLAGRPLFAPRDVQQALDDFYTGMGKARHSPQYVLGSFLLNLVRYVGGAAALYFAFLGLGWAIPLGVVILVFTSVSVLSSVSAVPGEMAILGTSFAVLSLAFGVPRDIALMSLILSRGIAFWLPMPIGYGAIWHLRRHQMI